MQQKSLPKNERLFLIDFYDIIRPKLPHHQQFQGFR